MSSPIASSSTSSFVPPSPTGSCASSLPEISDIEPITFILPDIIGYCPFELKVNPHFAEASKESDAWFESFNIHKGMKLQEFRRAKFGLLTAMSYPEADYAHFRNCADFMSWLFAFDDLTDDGGLRENIEGARKAADIMMKALRNPKTYRTEFKVGETLRSFWERACETASEGTQRRFLDTTQLYVDAIYQQVVNRRHDSIPSIEEFIQLRRDTSAVKLVFALVEYSLNLDLPDCVFEEPLIASLEQGANDILTWANDMYSFNVEQSKGDTQNLVFALVEYSLNLDLPDCVFEEPLIASLEQGANDILTWANDMYSFNVEQSKGDTQNLVVIAMNELDLDVQGAVDYVGELIKARIDQFVAEKHLLPSWGEDVDSQVAQYVKGLESWCLGSINWSFDSERYFGAEHARIKQDRIVTLLPVDVSMLPAPDSTIVGDDIVEEVEVAACPAAPTTPVASSSPSSSPSPSLSRSFLSSFLPSTKSSAWSYITIASMLFPTVLAVSLRAFELC